ncbi:hypothetical protein DXG01_005613, partial [Tephrocybe rancida]
TSLFRLDSGSRLRTFTVPVTRSKRPRQVSFVDDCSTIVSGSDHGTVYVFNRRSGDVVDRLKIGEDTWLQTVTAANVNGAPTIFAAKSQDNTEANDIWVWALGRSKPPAVAAPSPRTRERCSLYVQWYSTLLIELFMLVVVVVYVKQNLET